MKDVLLYDTTLRDGCQAEDISFTLEDKLRIAEKLAELGIDYIEGGYPGSNPRDADFFKRVKALKLKNVKIASFGTTRKPGAKPSQDLNLKVLLDADTPAVTLVGKTWDLHVRDDLRISQKANLEVIGDSIAFISSMAFAPIPTMRSPASKRRKKAAPTGSCSATPTAGACPAIFARRSAM
jgi:2-isopropylmalate synthase